MVLISLNVFFINFFRNCFLLFLLNISFHFSHTISPLLLFWSVVFLPSTLASGTLHGASAKLTPAHSSKLVFSLLYMTLVTSLIAPLQRRLIFVLKDLATKHGFSFPFRRGDLTGKRAWMWLKSRWHPLQLEVCPRFLISESFCQFSIENFSKKVYLSVFLRGFHLIMVDCKGGNLS